MEDNKIVDSLDAALDSPENTQEVIDDRVLIKQEDITAVLNQSELTRIKVTNQALQRRVKELAIEISRLRGILKMQGENINKPKTKEKSNATNG
tara:strand:+ start:291 stop:572 length:282 start_codon:yes stop_codon:yes gene_type:complete